MESISDNKNSRQVSRWLLAGVAMLLVQILLGGITRLTGSGLSIAEWKPILGALPPLNARAWQRAFDLYREKASGQYAGVYSGMDLGSFKSIYFWEWMHREWARAMGLVFIVGFVYFLVKRKFPRDVVRPFVILFLLGALQGLIGWIMVQSGLNESDVHVSHIRLAVHFLTALVLLAYTLWFALRVGYSAHPRPDRPRPRRVLVVLIGVLVLQLAYAAFMAGLRAAPVAATWPSINGSFFPDSFTDFGNQHFSGIHTWTDNPLVVQFMHRILAYLLILLTVGYLLVIRASVPAGTLLRRAAFWTLAIVGLQALLGIATVLHGSQMNYYRFGEFECLAIAHQLTGMLLLIAVLVNLFFTISAERFVK